MQIVNVMIWFLVKVSEHLSAQPLKALDTKAGHAGGHPCVYDQAPVNTLNTKAGVSFPCWQYPCVFSDVVAGEIGAIHTSPQGEDKWEIIPGNSESLPCVPFPWLSLASFGVENHNQKYNGFSEFFESIKLLRPRVVLGTLEHFSHHYLDFFGPVLFLYYHLHNPHNCFSI